jgi:hypothetical protein
MKKPGVAKWLAKALPLGGLPRVIADGEIHLQRYASTQVHSDWQIMAQLPKRGANGARRFTINARKTG